MVYIPYPKCILLYNPLPDLLCNSFSLREAASVLEDFCFVLFCGNWKFCVGKGFIFSFCFTAAFSILW